MTRKKLRKAAIFAYGGTLLLCLPLDYLGAITPGLSFISFLPFILGLGIGGTYTFYQVRNGREVQFSIVALALYVIFYLTLCFVVPNKDWQRLKNNTASAGIQSVEILSLPAFNVAGFSLRTTNKEEMNPQTAKIPGHWKKFSDSALAKQRPTYAVYTQYESDHNGPYSLVIGPKTSKPQRKLTLVSLPAQRYMKIPVQGEMPQALIKTWQWVWDYFENNTRLKRAYTTDFERYTDTSVEIYIALK